MAADGTTKVLVSPPPRLSFSTIIIPYSGKIWRGVQFGDLAVQEKIAKLNSANIKRHPSQPATRVCARTLVMHIRTYGSAVPVFQKRFSCCILPKECDIENSSLSGKELQAINESVRDIANDSVRSSA